MTRDEVTQSNLKTCPFSEDNFNAEVNKLKLRCETQQEPNKTLPHFVVPPFIYEVFMRVRKDNPSFNEIQCLYIALEKHDELMVIDNASQTP